MKYEKEIDDFLREMIYEDWMDENTYQEIIKVAFQKYNITKEQLDETIDSLVNHGWSVKRQLNILKQFI